MKIGTKISSIILTVAISIAATGCGNTDSTQDQQDTYMEVSEGDSAPDFTAETVDGDSFTLSEQNGKVVLLNFWATWCGPCVAEMPAFEKIYSEYGEEVAVLAVNCLEDKEVVDQFISDNSYTFPIAYDTDGTISAKYPTDGIPYTLVIGKNGTVKNIYVGAGSADAQYEEYKSAIEEAMNE